MQEKRSEPQLKHVGHESRRRTAHYVASCPACQADDQRRRDHKGPLIPDEDLGRTIFLVPDYAPENTVAKLYVSRRYPKAKNIGPVNFLLVPNHPEVQIVVVCRRPKPGGELLKTSEEKLMSDGKWVSQAVPIPDLLPDVLESAPILIAEACELAESSFTRTTVVSHMELVDRIADVAPGFRVFAGNPPDQLIELKYQG